MSRETDRIVNRYSHMVIRSLRYFRGSSLPSSIDKRDLEQAGIKGLLEAAARYEVRNNCSFETFAGSRIYGSMVDEIRSARPGTRKGKRPRMYSVESEGALEHFESEDKTAYQSTLARDQLRYLKNSEKLLSERERVVLYMYYRDGFSLDEIGQALGLTEGRICQIHKNAITVLRSGMSHWL